VRDWIAAVGAKTAFIETGSPWENGYCESFNAKLHDELLNGEIFHSLAEVKAAIESWRQYYNTRRPYSSLGDKPPAPAPIVPPSSVAVKPTMHWLKPDHSIGADHLSFRIRSECRLRTGGWSVRLNFGHQGLRDAR
jgi:hypothetical protein